MKSYANVRKALPLAGILARFLLVTFLTLATFNPSYYSVSTWIVSDGSLISLKAVTGFGLAAVWIVLLRMSLEGLGWLGLGFTGMAALIGAILAAQFGLLDGVAGYTLVLLLQIAFAATITFGLVFSYWVRQATGQSAVYKPDLRPATFFRFF